MAQDKQFDVVNCPVHYTGQGAIECIDYIAVVIAPYQGIVAGDLKDILKYTWRAKRKNGIEDLKKARWYAQHVTQQIRMQENDELSMIRVWRTACIQRTKEEDAFLEAACQQVADGLSDEEKRCYRKMMHAIVDANLYRYKKGCDWLLSAIEELISLQQQTINCEGGTYG